MNYVDADTMIEFKTKLLNKIDEKDQALLTPILIGSTKIIANLAGGNFSGVQFNLTNNYDGIYIFTYGRAMTFIPIYQLEVGYEYKVSAALCNSGGEYKNKILTYKLTSENKLQIYQKENYMPVDWTVYLFKIKLY